MSAQEEHLSKVWTMSRVLSYLWRNRELSINHWNTDVSSLSNTIRHSLCSEQMQQIFDEFYSQSWFSCQTNNSIPDWYCWAETLIWIFQREEKAEFFEYIDSAHANCLNSWRFIFNYMFFLWNESISWSFKHQQCVNTSSAEAEYVDECNAIKKLIFLIQVLKEMRYDDSNINLTIILADN